MERKSLNAMNWALVISTIYYSQHIALPDAVKGVKITPCTLMQLSPKMPTHMRSRLDNWLADAQTVQLLDGLTSLSDAGHWQEAAARAESAMLNAGYTNLSNANYAAYLPGAEYLFKVDGQKSRTLDMLASKGIMLAPEQQTDELIIAFAKRYVHESLPTYRTASRMAYYILLKDLMHKKGYRSVRVPDSYLVHIPGKPNTVEDGNVLMIQKSVPHAQKLTEHPELVQTIHSDTIAELYDAVVATGLWDIANNILLHKSGSIYVTCTVNLVGLAERKNSSSKDFFHKNKQRFDENVYIGLRSLLGLFKNDQSKALFIHELMRKDDRLKDSVYYVHLMNLAK